MFLSLAFETGLFLIPNCLHVLLKIFTASPRVPGPNGGAAQGKWRQLGGQSTPVLAPPHACSSQLGRSVTGSPGPGWHSYMPYLCHWNMMCQQGTIDSSTARATHQEVHKQGVALVRSAVPAAPCAPSGPGRVGAWPLHNITAAPALEPCTLISVPSVCLCLAQSPVLTPSLSPTSRRSLLTRASLFRSAR